MVEFDGQIMLLDTMTGGGITAFQGSERSLTFTLDGRQLACGGYGVITVRDCESGTPVHELRGHHEFVTALAFSPDGKRLASGGDDAVIKLWDCETGTEVLTLTGHATPVSKLGFSPDGRRLTSVDEGGVIRIWRTAEAIQITVD